jgi:hypothetical protein
MGSPDEGSTHMSTTMDVAREFLRADKLEFREVGDAIVVPFADDAGRWSATLLEVNDCFVCTAAYPVNVPAEHRSAVAELLARLNWPLLIGSWEMDWSDGEVRYRTSVPVRTAPLTAELARDLCYTNFGTFTRSWRPLASVSTGAATPVEALDAARSAAEQERRTFAEIMERIGFAPGEDPFEAPPADGTDGQADAGK